MKNVLVIGLGFLVFGFIGLNIGLWQAVGRDSLTSEPIIIVLLAKRNSKNSSLSTKTC